MKKIFPLLLCICLLLCGCGGGKECEHQWQGADCVKPETCSVCGETQGEALGHRWQEASCAAPETCSVCGETQGEALSHSFSEPEFAESGVSRLCSICAFEQRQSHEDYLAQTLPGDWLMHESVTADGVIGYEFVENRGGTITRLYVNEDKTLSITLGSHIADKTFEGLTWEYEGCGENEGAFFQSLRLVSPEAEFLVMLLHGEEGSAITLPVNVNGEIYFEILTKQPDLSSLLCGLWADTSGGMVSTVSLNEDHSAEIFINGEAAEGSWYTGHIDEESIERHARLTISCTSGGKSYSYSCELHLGESAAPLEAAAQEAYFYCYRLDKSFERVSRDEVEVLNRAVEMGKSLLLGQWYSTKVTEHQSGSGTERNCGDYGFNFAGDGSFTAELDRQYSGYWWLNDVQLNDTNRAYEYKLVFEGYEQTATIDMWVDNLGSSGDSVFSMNVDDYPRGYTLEFARERAENKSKFAGLWLGCYQGEISTLELGEDYSFSSDVLGGIEGIWRISSTSTNGDYADYNLEFEYAGGTLYANYGQYIGPGSDDAAVEDIYLSGCIFEKVQAHELEDKKAGLMELMDSVPGRLTGLWLPEEGENARGDDGVDYSGYSVTFNEDGSFTAEFEKQYSGTWELESLNENVAYLKLLTGNDGLNCTLYLNFDKVHISFVTGEAYHSYDFARG